MFLTPKHLLTNVEKHYTELCDCTGYFGLETEQEQLI